MGPPEPKLEWLNRFLRAIEKTYEAVVADRRLPTEKKEWPLTCLGLAKHRIREAIRQWPGTGLTDKLKNEILQAVIEAADGGLFTY